MSKTLGLDLGPNSIGWALVEENSDGTGWLIDCGVRVFPEGVDAFDTGKESSRNEQRRMARMMRRQIRRRALRKKIVAAALVEAGMLPADDAERARVLEMDPYPLRACALTEKLEPHEIGRVIYHLNQRRGFLSLKKVSKAKIEKELRAIEKKRAGAAKATAADGDAAGAGKEDDDSKMLAAIELLAQRIGERTLGQTLYEQQTARHSPIPVRIRNQHTRRSMIEDEFLRNWHHQKQYHPELLSDTVLFGSIGRQDAQRTCENLRRDPGKTLLQQFGVHGLIFHQRPIYWPREMIGMCDLEKGQRRCHRADRRAQRFRMLQEINNLRWSPPGKFNEKPLDAEQRATVLAKLYTTERLTFDQLRKLLGFLDGVKFNLERGERSSIKGCETDFRLAKEWKDWHKLDESAKDEIVRVLVDAERDSAAARERLLAQWKLPEDVADTLLSVDLTDGYVGYSLKAIEKLMPHLERGLILMGKSDADALGSSAHIIYAGDFNLTSGSSETAYQDLLASGNGQAHDPLNAAGWGNNSTWTHILTESSDDLTARFDFQLVTGPMLNQSGMQINAASYEAIGNASTTTFGNPIDDAGNTAALSDLANRTTILGYMADQTVTDHLPVAADYQTVGILPTTVWTGGTGTWSTASKWMTGIVPNSSTLLAALDDGNNTISSVTLDTNATVGGVLLDSGDSLTISSGHTLTVTGLATSTFAGSLNNAGTLAITGGTARLLSGGSDSGNFSVASGATLEFAADANTSVAGAITGSGTLAKTGAGALTLGGNNTYTGDTTISAGILTFSKSFRTGSSLTVANGAKAVLSVRSTPSANVLEISTLDLNSNGTLDLNDNDLVVDNGVFSNIQSLVQAGFRSSTDPSATGIISSTSQANGGHTILELVDNSLVGDADWPVGSGNTVAANAIIGKYTYFGDTNLDGAVTGDDYSAVDANLGTTPLAGEAILMGDTNFDGQITGDDYSNIDANLGLGVGNPLAASNNAPVPDPGPITLLGLGALGMLSHRRRWQHIA